MASGWQPGQLDEAWRARQRHQPYFCEENVWQLLQAPDLPAPREALFVTNRTQTVAMWGQRAAVRDPLVWDYHVVLLLPQQRAVVDLDDRVRPGHRLAEWLAHAFRAEVEAEFRPWFRRVPAAEFLAVFASDRSHMRDAAGRPRQPFPPWPAPGRPGQASNLARFLDLDDPIAGTVVDAAGLLAGCGG